MALVRDPKDDGYVPVTLQAHDLVFGDRQASYGHPLDDFSCTATCWQAYLKHRMHSKLRANWEGSATDLQVFLGWFDEYFGVDAEDFGPMMILAKVSRQANAPKPDNMVDTAGYAETTERVIFERARREKLQADFISARVDEGLKTAAEQIEAQKAQIDPVWGADKPPYNPFGANPQNCSNRIGVKLDVVSGGKPQQVREALTQEMLKQVIRQGDKL